jgi:hypothetical protein
LSRGTKESTTCTLLTPQIADSDGQENEKENRIERSDKIS